MVLIIQSIKESQKVGHGNHPNSRESPAVQLEIRGSNHLLLGVCFSVDYLLWQTPAWFEKGSEGGACPFQRINFGRPPVYIQYRRVAQTQNVRFSIARTRVYGGRACCGRDFQLFFYWADFVLIFFSVQSQGNWTYRNQFASFSFSLRLFVIFPLVDYF